MGECKWRVCVSMCCLHEKGKIRQIGFKCVNGQNMLWLRFSIHWAYDIFEVCVMYTPKMLGFSKNILNLFGQYGH